MGRGQAAPVEKEVASVTQASGTLSPCDGDRYHRLSVSSSLSILEVQSNAESLTIEV
jgi:hypothetical protein